MISEKGSAILIALLLMLLLGGVTVLTIDTATNEIDMSYNQIHEEQAFYIAEAGAKRAVAALNQDSTWRSGYTDLTFGDGRFTVVVTDSTDDAGLADTVVIASTGQIRGGKSAVELTVIPGEINPFTNAMFGENSVDIRNSMATDSYNSDSGSYAATQENLAGDLGSNGTITVKNGAIIGGNVATSQTGGLNVHAGATVIGDMQDDAPEVDLPPIPQSDFDWAEANNDAASGISGSYTYDAATSAFESTGTVTLSEGTYFFSSIILKNSASLVIPPGDNVTIYVTGDIELKNSAGMNDGGKPSQLLIYSQGDFVLKNSGDIHAAFYNPEGEADLRNSGEFYGSVTAYDIIAHNSALFHYDRDLGNISTGRSGEWDVVAWGEIY